MIDITNLKPSDYLTLMVQGLLYSENRDDFRIDMSTFGSKDSNGICFGCAATVTLEKIIGQSYPSFINEYLTNRGFSVDRILVRSFGDIYVNDQFDARELEYAIDEARCGNLEYLFGFCDLDYNYDFNDRFDLDTENWKEQIPEVLKVIDELKLYGF